MRYALRVTRRVLTGMLLLTVVGCAPKAPLVKPGATVQELYDTGLSLLQTGKYDKAIEVFQRITLEHANTRYAADAQFNLAECYVSKKDFAQAAIEYDFLTTNYPTSPFYEEALYKTALCYFRQSPKAALDQADLKKTRDQLALFRERFPDSRFRAGVDSLEGEIASRLARKEYETGLLYAKAGEWTSARVYFQHVLELYPGASLAPEARYQLALCLLGLNETSAGRKILEELTTGDFPPELKQKAQARLEKILP